MTRTQILLGSFVDWGGYTTCVLYLICGSLVTKVKKREKEEAGIAEGRGGARGPETGICGDRGVAYGKTTYLVTTLRQVPRGTEGAVSLEGTLAGVVGSLVITAYACTVGLVPIWPAAPASIIAAFVATTFESLGATVQGSIPILTNEVINFINTLVGAAVGMAIAIPFL
ncbi:hypothetical protein CTAYLR_006438 [Chrysophaeum taylorii]|uniref:DUF92 domain-containing protein n=1 Tax=Chrysophaeum taylorii TaxID=2483200 RepID=A0AAD7UMC1_9STRA|nr:hypothetical protein CTAYLR_006438 [Chrysophaeum taylorii]